MTFKFFRTVLLLLVASATAHGQEASSTAAATAPKDNGYPNEHVVIEEAPEAEMSDIIPGSEEGEGEETDVIPGGDEEGHRRLSAYTIPADATVTPYGWENQNSIDPKIILTNADGLACNAQNSLQAVAPPGYFCRDDTHADRDAGILPYVVIDLKEGALMNGITIYHAQKVWCNMMTEISIDGVNWLEVYATPDGHGGHSVHEPATGYRYNFPLTHVRQIRHTLGHSWPGERHIPCISKVKVHGVLHKTRIAASPNGKHVIALWKREVYYMPGLLADGVWHKFTGALDQVGVDDHGIIHGIAGVMGYKASIHHCLSHSNQCNWSTEVGHVIGLAVSGSGSRLGGVNGVKAHVRNSNDGTWVNTGWWTTHVALSHDGDMMVICHTWDCHYGGINGQTLLPGFQKLNGAYAGRDLSFGHNRLWMLQRDGTIWTMRWWRSTDPATLNWIFWGSLEKFDQHAKMMEIAGTKNGLFGVSSDGIGIVFCRDLKLEEYDLRCEYIIGPGGPNPTV